VAPRIPSPGPPEWGRWDAACPPPSSPSVPAAAPGVTAFRPKAPQGVPGPPAFGAMSWLAAFRHAADSPVPAKGRPPSRASQRASRPCRWPAGSRVAEIGKNRAYLCNGAPARAIFK